MMKIKKDYNEKIVTLFVAVGVLLNTSAYAISVFEKTYLRKPLDFNNTELNGARYQDALLRNSETKIGFQEKHEDEVILGEIGFNPLEALRDPEILSVFRQIVELRYDVRILAERYKLGTVPQYLTHNGEKVSVSEYVDKMINFLISRADQDPHSVSKAFREEFPNMARPPELDPIFDEYMKIKLKEFDLEVLRDAIPPNSIIADIGAGKNKLGRQILEYSDQAGLNIKYVIGTDLNDWTDKTGKPDPRLSFIYQESSTQFPLSANTYDVVIVKWVLHHMTYENQITFLKSINHILRPGGRLIIFEALGATHDEKEIWEGFQVEARNTNTWPKGSFFNANLKLTEDFMMLNSEQQRKVHALEDFFGHNLVMGRDWMPQPFTYRPVSGFQELLTKLGFMENKTLRRVYGSAPIMRMGPPSIRLVFEKNITSPILTNGDGGENKAMVLIDGVSAAEREHMRTILDVLVHQDLLRREMENKKFDDVVILGSERLDTFSEALDLIESNICQRIVILGKYGRATIPLIDSAVKNGFKVRISSGTMVNNENWWDIRRQLADKNRGEVIQMSEAHIIKQIILQLIETYPEEFKNVKRKIDIEGTENMLVLIDESEDIGKLFIQYRTLLDKKRAFDKEGGHSIVFLQKPEQQLRSKAAFDEVLAYELRQGKVKTISHTVSYDNVERDRVSAFKDLLNEAWRLIIYSDYGTAYINLRNEKYPRGINDIPKSFWKSASFLFNALADSDKRELAKEMMALVENEGLSFDKIIPSQVDNSSLREFIETIKSYYPISFEQLREVNQAI